VAFRKEVANACGVGFDVPSGSIEPIEPKIEALAKQKAIGVNPTTNALPGHSRRPGIFLSCCIQSVL
jgi:hypothetical protein